MIDLLREIAAGLFLFAGAFFLLAGAIGMNRMPDLFTRMHAASVGDTLGVSLMLIGMVFLAGFTLVTVKLVFLLGFLLFMGPVASHALAAAALQAGVKPVLAENGESKKAEPKKAEPTVKAPARKTSSRKRGKP
ncbi:monovalent cation/H(+) antiporter subunit G [Kaistia sp. MMO-174]|jgi:multicomponent Na+:H+ antiporter subunit G|uniref:monovalent cation/H(+) antiporter subunit G n=1 Tax=Kaistia sp. MMO-174 TaxID=3081256 RepID=UPI001AC9170F|nr:monovalent cation/H(+) antiporter subunit G [Hyphomicrobiales bacterium]